MRELILGYVAPMTVIASLVMAAVLILASLYDVIGARRTAAIERMVRKLRYPRQPHVTVLIYGEASTEQLAACIAHINQSHYRSIDIVLISGPVARLDSHVVRERILQSKYAIRWYRMRSRASEAIGLQRGYERSKRGEVVVALHPMTRVTPQYIKRAIARLQLSGERVAIRCAYRDERELQVSTLLPLVVSQSYLMWQKARQVVGSRRSTLGTGYVYPQAMMKAVHRSVPYHFDASIVAVRPYQWYPASTFVAMVWVVVCLAFLVVSVVVMEAAASLTTASPFLIVYLLCCFWLLAIIWLDDNMKFSRKVIISLTVPPGYFIVLANILVYPIMKTWHKFATRLSLH